MHEMHKITMKRCITCIKENDKIEKAMLKINSAYATI